MPGVQVGNNQTRNTAVVRRKKTMKRKHVTKKLKLSRATLLNQVGGGTLNISPGDIQVGGIQAQNTVIVKSGGCGNQSGGCNNA
jgi:hypothetical protein